MSTKKSDIERSQAKKDKAIVSDKVRSYEKHPFFIKKKADAKAFLEKTGLPADMKKS